MKNNHLLIIDPQNDFMDILAKPGEKVGAAMPDGTNFRSTLPVPGAVEDMKRLAKAIGEVGKRLAGIHITLDSHQLIDIAHPVWWIDKNGKNPNPFTIISAEDVENGVWTARHPAYRQQSLEYVKELEAKQRYQLCIWPPHCLIGTWGHNVQKDLNQAIQKWIAQEFFPVDYIVKGTNPFTEHYGALEAEVPFPGDETTALNLAFLELLEEADVLAIAGEAFSHCVKETVDQIVRNVGKENLKKIFILEDCSSPVPAVPGGPDFPQIVEDWKVEMKQKGLNFIAADELKKVV